MKRQVTRNRRGFTLAELVIVVLVIGIMTAVAAPKYADSLARFRVKAAAKRIAADLNYSRSQAKATGVSKNIQFSVGANNYILTGLEDLNHPGQSYQVNLSDTGHPASLSSADFGSGGTMVTFDFRGRPDNGGTVVVQSGGYTASVVVDGDWGEAVVQ